MAPASVSAAYPHPLKSMAHGVIQVPLKTPVAFFIFNRPKHTSTSFARIRDQRPRDLFLIADGPRPGNQNDAEQCQRVLEIVEHIDWPCAVHRNFANTNMGLKSRVGSGLDWVFSQVDQAIVLEDDCVAREDFFHYCEALLALYEDDDRVAVITGNNFQDGIVRGEGAYYFSKYNHVWGWATWRRAWTKYDSEIRFWKEWKKSPHWQAIHSDSFERRYWERIFDRVAAGEIESWAYPWMASMWYQNGLTATPNAHLVSNIGFGPEATHTRDPHNKTGRDTEPLGPLGNPPEIYQDVEADRYTFDHHFGGAELRLRRRPMGFLRWVGDSALRRLRTGSRG